MNTQTFQIEAETLELARMELKARIPTGFFVQSEKIISAGEPLTSREMAETYAEAVSKARANITDDYSIVETKEDQ